MLCVVDFGRFVKGQGIYPLRGVDLSSLAMLADYHATAQADTQVKYRLGGLPVWHS
ncbi:hypothetical protein [Moraxella cuniculi]|uniref:hypothetical protein n=1 Tax=Moraxella cuniculi TaxID=34061 RepID=UPI0013019349|nr:hypothetical protein [Moraxella cuniculi]